MRYSFYDSDGCIIIITHDKNIGIRYVQSTGNVINYLCKR